LAIRVENSVEDSKIQISSLKLEKGNKATDWTPAPEDIEAELKNKLSSKSEIEADFQYSWDEDGLQMWDCTGEKTKEDKNRIFAVVKEEINEGEINGYKLKMRGEVVAESGSIGAWTIGSDSIFARTDETISGEKTPDDNMLDKLGSVGMYRGNEWTAKSLLPGGGYSPVRFYAGLKKNNDTGEITANFLVLEDGSVYMTAGEIGHESVISNGEGEISF
jgi:hypothetical protein